MTLVWDGPDPDVAGYRLHYGVAPCVYPQVIDIGLANSCTVPDLVQGTPYFFAVTAYSQVGIESDFSSEIVFSSGSRLASIFLDEQGTVLRWGTAPGSIYRVLATESLGDPVWVDVSGPLVAVSTTRLWTHIRATGSGSLFYRLELISGIDNPCEPDLALVH